MIAARQWRKVRMTRGDDTLPMTRDSSDQSHLLSHLLAGAFQLQRGCADDGHVVWRSPPPPQPRGTQPRYHARPRDVGERSGPCAVGAAQGDDDPGSATWAWGVARA